jgi:NADH-quinone oxidoreductase subunit L
MTLPLVLLAGLAVVAGFFGTPMWPWFQSYLEGGKAVFDFSRLMEGDQLPIMLLSTGFVAAAILLSGWIYGRKVSPTAREKDPLETAQPALFALLQYKFYVDEIYEATVVRLTKAFAVFSDWLDRKLWDGVVRAVSWLTVALARLSESADETVVNGTFDAGTETVRDSGKWVSHLQNGQTQRYLGAIGLAFCGLLILLLWGTQ